MRPVAVSLVLLASGAVAQTVSWAPPVRLLAGQKMLGQGRLFPSPVYQDLDRDGRLDIVVGDLLGVMTVACRGQDDAITFGDETKVLGADGAPVNLHNW